MRVLIIAPSHPGLTPGQGPILARLLRKEGIQTSVLSAARTGAGRAVDVLVRGFLSAVKNDVVIVNVYGNWAFVYEGTAILYARLAGRRIISVVRSGGMADFTRRWPRFTRAVLGASHRTLVPHGFLAEELTKLGIRIDGILPNFIEIERYPFRHRDKIRPRFLYVRGMHTYYNPQMALRVLAAVQERYPDASLTMTGEEGAESASCREMARAWSLHNVHFAGLVSKQRLIELAASHDIHLNTNMVENMPVSVIEMWACGVPVIATRVGGTPWLVRDGEDALLVPSDDHEAMTRAVFRLLESPALAARLSTNGRARAEGLSWVHIREKWLSVLREGYTSKVPAEAPEGRGSVSIGIEGVRRP